MKSFHLRFEDNDFEKIQKISSELGLSINGYLTQKFAEFDLDKEMNMAKSDKENRTKYDDYLSQIYITLCDIVVQIESVKCIQEDINLKLDLNPNIDSDDIDYLMKCIKNLKRSAIESTEKIYDKLAEIK